MQRIYTRRKPLTYQALEQSNVLFPFRNALRRANAPDNVRKAEGAFWTASLVGLAYSSLSGFSKPPQSLSSGLCGLCGFAVCSLPFPVRDAEGYDGFAVARDHQQKKPKLRVQGAQLRMRCASVNELKGGA
ncbi:MAG TPA: hypothetical protein VER96_35820 [Polyangiaceae bacterium]|nr:hypothetical protein [Polyangiaceae bacterium]